MTLWTLPHIVWGVYGTPISFGDVIKIMIGPLLSEVVGWQEPGSSMPLHPVVAFPRLLLGVAILSAAYYGQLFFGIGQKTFYMDLLRGLLKRPSVEVEQPVVTQEA
jgi:hypothetical protein